ncbi:Receptor-like serine/threonine-protein kinase [Forsythia ovata]|uniref:Receptor-like serine/threonine-protein kinase n=1 Tax=Forsythia ovata TaxID=205694 RepID=A0ABD1S512_9LAMI
MVTDQLLLGWIYNALSPAIASQYLGCETGSRLIAVHQSQIKTGRIDLPNLGLFRNCRTVIYRTVRRKPHNFSIIKPSGIKSRPAPERLLWWVMSRNVVDTAVVNHGTIMRNTGIECSDTLSPYQVFKNGQTLVSDNKRFELGFFNVSSTNDHNHGMWYLGYMVQEIKQLTAVWVGNMMKPLRGFGMRIPVSKLELVLMDSGNLVIKDGDNLSDGGFVWQSFDFPSDTLLPGMKLGWDLKAGLQHVMASWRSSEDSSYGEFLFSLESPQLLLDKNEVPKSRWGPWDGQR